MYIPLNFTQNYTNLIFIFVFEFKKKYTSLLVHLWYFFEMYNKNTFTFGPIFSDLKSLEPLV